jgi:hypothetical protein
MSKANKLILLVAAAALISASMLVLMQNVQVVRADVPKGCTGDPHDIFNPSGDPHNDDDSGNPHRGHHDSCPGDH